MKGGAGPRPEYGAAYGVGHGLGRNEYVGDRRLVLGGRVYGDEHQFGDANNSYNEYEYHYDAGYYRHDAAPFIGDKINIHNNIIQSPEDRIIAAPYSGRHYHGHHHHNYRHHPYHSSKSISDHQPSLPPLPLDYNTDAWTETAATPTPTESTTNEPAKIMDDFGIKFVCDIICNEYVNGELMKKVAYINGIACGYIRFDDNDKDWKCIDKACKKKWGHGPFAHWQSAHAAYKNIDIGVLFVVI